MAHVSFLAATPDFSQEALSPLEPALIVARSSISASKARVQLSTYRAAGPPLAAGADHSQPKETDMAKAKKKTAPKAKKAAVRKQSVAKGRGK